MQKDPGDLLRIFLMKIIKNVEIQTIQLKCAHLGVLQLFERRGSSEKVQ